MSDFKFNTKRTSLSISERKTSLGRSFINKYLHDKGYSIDRLLSLSTSEAKPLITEACIFASLKLAEIEARAGLYKKISAQPF